MLATARHSGLQHLKNFWTTYPDGYAGVGLLRLIQGQLIVQISNGSDALVHFACFIHVTRKKTTVSTKTTHHTLSYYWLILHSHKLHTVYFQLAVCWSSVQSGYFTEAGLQLRYTIGRIHSQYFLKDVSLRLYKKGRVWNILQGDTDSIQRRLLECSVY